MTCGSNRTEMSGSFREKLLSKLVLHKNVWVTLFIVLYIWRFVHIALGSLHAHGRLLKAQRLEICQHFFCPMTTKVRLLKQNRIILNEWQSIRLHDSFVFTLNLMCMYGSKQLHSHIMLHNMTTNHTLVVYYSWCIINYNILVVALKIIFPKMQVQTDNIMELWVKRVVMPADFWFIFSPPSVDFHGWWW
jgi:hypothetical protein